MALNSFIYECVVMHNRVRPKHYHLKHHLYIFQIDLDEFNEDNQIPAMFPMLGLARWNWFNFRPDTHAITHTAKTLKQRIQLFLKEQDVLENAAKIHLITQCHVLGYVFNPVSFYFCYSSENKPLGAVAEVGNTFYETKLYFVPFNVDKQKFESREVKNFYVSPFSGLQDQFAFQLQMTEEGLFCGVNTFNPDQKPVLQTWIKCSQKKELSRLTLLKFALKYPFLPFQIIAFIHGHAFLLMIKRIPFFQKTVHPEQQTHVLRPHSSLLSKETPHV
jgi:uncharacterized protein